MTILAWIVLGLVAGLVARTIVDRHGSGIVLDTLLGIGGAIVGGLAFTAAGAAGVTGFDLASLGVAGAGAGVALGAYHAVAWRRVA
jgi:uncharacterized membrane protein YeaQ/YmgE (transglycosylase-associated protein family)